MAISPAATASVVTLKPAIPAPDALTRPAGAKNLPKDAPSDASGEVVFTMATAAEPAIRTLATGSAANSNPNPAAALDAIIALLTSMLQQPAQQDLGNPFMGALPMQTFPPMQGFPPMQAPMQGFPPLQAPPPMTAPNFMGMPSSLQTPQQTYGPYNPAWGNSSFWAQPARPAFDFTAVDNKLNWVMGTIAHNMQMCNAPLFG